MIKLLHHLSFLGHVDPRVFELEKHIEFLHIVIWGLALVIGLLLLIVYLQRKSITLYRKSKSVHGKEKKGLIPGVKKKAVGKPAAIGASVAPKELPDPGLIFKYSLAKENVMEKTVTIGQKQGNIKTYSTEIIDDHLSVSIRIMENRRDKDIYDLPDTIVEEYLLDFRRDGKALIYYQGLEGYREMGSRERIYLKEEPDVTGDPTFPKLDAKQPIRFRVGDRLNQDGKFISGFFEFHLFTQDYQVSTKAGIPKIEKNFLIRLYKIYPGYDTGAPTDDGLYPMIDPFTTR